MSSQGSENSLKTEAVWKGKEVGRTEWPRPVCLSVPAAFVEKTTFSSLNCLGTFGKH